MSRNGSVAQTPARTGVRFTIVNTSLAIAMTMWYYVGFVLNPHPERSTASLLANRAASSGCRRRQR